MESTFEQLLVELSTRFTGLPAESVDAEVEWGLRSVVEWLDTDRSSLFLIQPDDTLLVTHSWARPGLEQVTPATATRRQLPWYHHTLAGGEVVRMKRLPDDLPPEAAREREVALALGMKSNLAVPIAVGGRYTCALTTGAFREYRDWDEATVQRLRLVGQVLANALHRKRAEETLRAQLDEIRKLTDRLEAENVYLREEVRGGDEFTDVVGQSAALRKVLDHVAQVAPTDSSVLLLGETGTGKELVARAIHERSPRRARPFIKVNCAALPAALLESEMFGHEKGAFTGAAAAHPGRFELADGGTLFLDEIGELAVELQAKLLRVLQDGEVQRLGSTRPRRVDVRLVAATNQNLDQAISAGRFRADLYYRLSVFPILLPALRERREDVPLLVWAFIQRRQARLGRHIESIPRAAMDALVSYHWPGNIRELENVLERALILTSGPTLRLDEGLGTFVAAAPAAGGIVPGSVDASFDGAAREHVLAVLSRCGWRINGPGGAAEVLAVHPNTLRSRMKRLGIERPGP